MKNDEIRVLFETYIADIRYTKQQQWNTVYLTLVALAAVVTLNVAFSFPCSIRNFLAIVSSFIGALGILYICNYHRDLTKYRTMKNCIYESAFDVTVTELLKEFPRKWEPAWEDMIREKDFVYFVLPFFVLILLATIITVMVLGI
jgi:hypothetical protein